MKPINDEELQKIVQSIRNLFEAITTEDYFIALRILKEVYNETL